VPCFISTLDQIDTVCQVCCNYGMLGTTVPPYFFVLRRKLHKSFTLNSRLKKAKAAALSYRAYRVSITRDQTSAIIDYKRPLKDFDLCIHNEAICCVKGHNITARCSGLSTVVSRIEIAVVSRDNGTCMQSARKRLVWEEGFKEGMIIGWKSH
jgi:hypothetical protein